MRRGAVRQRRLDQGGFTDGRCEQSRSTKRSRPLLGTAVLLGLKPSGASEWTGSLYDAENGRTYIGKLTIVDERHIKVAGCVLGGLICESQIWTRTK